LPFCSQAALLGSLSVFVKTVPDARCLKFLLPHLDFSKPELTDCDINLMSERGSIYDYISQQASSGTVLGKPEHVTLTDSRPALEKMTWTKTEPPMKIPGLLAQQGGPLTLSLFILLIRQTISELVKR
jgi:hypothetical protein